MGEAVGVQRTSTSLELTIGHDIGRRVSEEAVDLLRWMRRAHASIRSTKRLKRSKNCRWVDVLNTRMALTPYWSKGVVLEVDGPGGTRTAAVCKLANIIDTMVACASREQGSLAQYEADCVLVIVAFDGTPFHQTSATRCDVMLDIWDDVGAHALPTTWATWWLFDGSDDSAHLQRVDIVGNLTDQVRELEGRSLVVRGKPLPYRCAITGDGKAMAAGNPKKNCRCWNCDRRPEEFNIAWVPEDEMLPIARFGALIPCVPPVRRIGDTAHCTARVTTGFSKRLRAAAYAHSRAAGLAIKTYFSDLAQEAKKIPIAERVRQASRSKEHTLDITCAQMFCKSAELHAALVVLVKDMFPFKLKWGNGRWLRVHLVIQMLLHSLYHLHAVWRSRIHMTGNAVVEYNVHVVQFADCWRALGWTVPTWVHWVIVHSTSVLRRWHNFVKFSSITSEYRNQGFKMDVRHCFQGWKLSRPYLTRWGLRNCLHLDALDWGLRMHYGRKYKGQALAALRDGMCRKRPRSTYTDLDAEWESA